MKLIAKLRELLVGKRYDVVRVDMMDGDVIKIWPSLSHRAAKSFVAEVEGEAVHWFYAITPAGRFRRYDAWDQTKAGIE